MLEGWRMRSEICFESWWELRTIMLCSVAGCCGMLMKIAPTFNTAALLVFSPRCALYKAWDFAMLHFTTVLRYKYTQTKGTYYKGSFWNHRLDVILNSNIKQCLWNMYRQILAKCTNEMFMWLETRPCRCRESNWKERDLDGLIEKMKERVSGADGMIMDCPSDSYYTQNCQNVRINQIDWWICNFQESGCTRKLDCV